MVSFFYAGKIHSVLRRSIQVFLGMKLSARPCSRTLPRDRPVKRMVFNLREKSRELVKQIALEVSLVEYIAGRLMIARETEAAKGRKIANTRRNLLKCGSSFF